MQWVPLGSQVRARQWLGALQPGKLVFFVLIWFALNGYSFGIEDHAIHLPYLLREMDPSFLRGDLLLEAMGHHPSYFWKLQSLLVRWLSLEAFYLGLHVLSVAAMFAGASSLTRALYPGELGERAAALTPVLILVAQISLASIPTMDVLVLNRTVSLGPLLFALALGARRRYHAAFVLVGVVFLIHPTTALHTALLLAMAALADPERRRAVLTGPLLCMLAAAPLLLPMLLHPPTSGVPFPAPEEWLQLTRLLLYFHHYPREWSLEEWTVAAGPLLLLGAALRARRCRPAEVYLLGLVLIFIVGALGTEVFSIPLAQQLHLLEVTRFLDFLAAACGAAWVLETWPAPGARRLPGLAPALAAVGFVTDLLVLVVLGVLAAALLKPVRREVPAQPAPGLPLALGLALTLLGAGYMRIALGIDITYQARFETLKGARVMAWAREHLPRDAVVAIPPYFMDPLASFRYGARRSIIGTFKDGSEGSFSAALLHEWRQRMEALCDCRPFEGSWQARLAGLSAWERVLETERALVAGYRAADGARFRTLAARFGATHAVVERDAREPGLPLLYEDEEYRVYRILP